MKFDKLKFVVLLYWRGSALAFPSGEGGTANAVTEEVYRQYVFAKTLVITQLFTAPLPPPPGAPHLFCAIATGNRLSDGLRPCPKGRALNCPLNINLTYPAAVCYHKRKTDVIFP